MTVDNNHIPSCSELLKFIETHAKALNTSETERGLPLIKRSMKLQVHNLTKANCFLCQQEHGIYLCPTFLDMEPLERRRKVKQLKLCFNCLRNNHSVNQCRSEFKCRKCQGKHNTLIHIDANIHQFKEHTVGIPAIEEPDKNQAESSVKENNDALGVTSIHNTTCLMSNQEDSFVLLSTATIMVMNHQGKYQPCRALIDTASQATLITRDCLKKLNLEPSRTRVELAGIGGQISDRPNGVINLNFTSHFNMSRIFKTNALVVDKVTSYMPYLKFEEHQFDHFQGLQLADPQYQYTAPIDILLGADIAFSLFKGAIKYGHEGQPKAIKTLLGWLLFGEIKTFQKKSRNYQQLHTFNCTLNNWEPIFSLWEEELKTKPDPFEDDFNEIHFKTTHERETSGRYIVRLPFKDPSLLGESKPQAINCFLRMEQILKQQPQVYQTYKDFMQEYLVLGHMNEVKGNGNDHKAFYLPHHPIIKEKSSTTKLRVVFNASSKTTTGYSLNDILHTGPKLQKDIFPLLLRFRSHPIAISADITKMYRQILVHPEDTPYQRIIWRDESGQGLKEYELKTLTYGTSCAPFLAIRVLKQLAHDEQIRFPTAEAILKSDFYVDDLLTGCETVENGRKLIRELDQLLQAGGFKLRQWASNKPTILDTLQETDKSTFYANVDRENTLGINFLGINWNPMNDEIGLRKLEIIKNAPTKRNILSQMAKIYDPLGWFALVMLKIKLMIQTLWAAKLTWDEPIPVRLQESWKALQNDLASLHQVQIPRWIGLFEPATYEIHGFADASQRAYAAMVYIKIIHNSSIHEVYLLAAKTRVATLKTTTTPRMELCASLLLAQLTRLVCTAMSLNINKVTLWSDSTIVLSWLASEHNRWKPYVSNRVKDIQELLPCRWMHVKGEDNPADLASRGISLDQLLDLELWWHGPPWLKTTSQPYNDAIPVINEKCLSEQRIKTNLFVKRNISYPFITRYSSLNKLKRITRWIFRFFYNCRKLLKREKSGALSIEEIETSFNRIIRCAQQEDYYIDLKQLEAFQPLSGKSPLIKLNPFLDKAIHIELVTNLTTEAFLAALRRFIGRRGRPAEINTDNATNFVGAYKDLRKLFNSNIHDFASSEEIKWNFIPPSSPHFGGLWEAGIKSVKYHLRRIVGKTKLTFEELTTVLTQIEACLNSRPLYPLTDDLEDLNALTAGHFLIGMPLTAVPSLVRESGSSLKGRWQLVEQIKTDFWKRWSCEYFSRLQNRPKWLKPVYNIKIGTLVLLKEDNLPPLKWRMGRINQVYPGEDGLVRVVSVKTADGDLRRAVAKTYEEVKESLCAVYPRRPSFTLQEFYELKCTSMAEIETYYKNKVRIGLAINLPKSAIVQALSNGVPHNYGNLLKMAQPLGPEEWLCLAQQLTYEGDNTSTKAAQQRSPRQSRAPSTTVDKTPPYPCRYCGRQHWHAQCQQRGPYQRTFRTFTPAVHSVEQPQRSTGPAGVYETAATTSTGETKLTIDFHNQLILQNSVPVPKHLYHFVCDLPTCKHGSRIITSNPKRPIIHSVNLGVDDFQPPREPYLQTTLSNIYQPSPECPSHPYNLNSLPTSPCASRELMIKEFIEQRPELTIPYQQLLYSFKDIFPINNFNVLPLNITPVKLKIISDKVISLRPYRTPYAYQKEIQDQISQLLKHDIITPSSSPYSSPVTLVRKRDNTMRLCIDFRRVNELVPSDLHPLPLIEMVLDNLSKARVFSTVDISNAYYQIPIAEESQPLLSFVTQQGQYNFKRLPFGFKSAPQIFERVITQLIHKQHLSFIAHYYDDFVIFSDSSEQHLTHLRLFFKFCLEENLQINLKKCNFYQNEIDFLGYHITAGTYTPNIKNTEIINAIRTPINIKTLQSFLGAINVYHKFIPEYARLRHPLNQLLKKNAKWLWSPNCQQAFDKLKQHLATQPVLHLFQEGLPCQVYCDASTQGIAGVLKQVHPDGNIYPVQYYSRALRSYERNYTISELECLAIVECVDKFRVYLLGTKFVIYSDHHALQWLKTIKDPTGRLFRWSLRLSAYDYEVKYLKGSRQYEADLLSRNPFCGFLSTGQIKDHQGELRRDTRTTLTCRGCGQTGHKERNCTRPKEGLKVANLEVEGLETVPPDVYLKDVKIDNKETVKAMIDTGSSSCLMRESVARRISVDIEPDSTSLYGIGNQTAPASRTVGKTTVDLEIDRIVGREITVFIVNDDAQPYDLLIGRTWTDLPYVSFARIGKNLHIGYLSEFPFANLQEEIKSRRIELRATETVQLESDSINFTSAITDEVKDGYVLFTGVDDACVDSLLEVVDGKTTVPIISAGKGKLRVRKNQCVGRVELLNLDDIVVNLDVAEDSFQTKNEEKREGQDQMKRKRPILPEDINVNHSLTSKERQEILDVVNEYRDYFALGMEELGCTDVTKMDIKEVDGSKPVCLRPYKTTASEREAIREIVREWKDNGIVTETRSPYASPVLLVRKKTGDHRLVVDYRRLNIQTVKDKFPLPRIDDLLEGLRNAKFFTTLDLAHGYLQIPLTDKAKLKTAFITPDDTGQFERMIFGLANAPAEFQRLMHTVLGPLLNKKAFCYLDDVIIPAKDWREMIERLREVLERIRSAKLTLKPSKCEFGRREIEFLGYVISTGGLEPGPRKIKAIEEFPEPKNVHDIRRFLGLTNFFRRFVKDFARKAEPLSRLTKKGSQFEWKEEQRRSFGGLRKDLVEYPVLAHYNPELKTEVHCDASAEGLAGMVLQMDEDGKWRLVYCVSKKTTEAEKMYHSSKLELMAIVWTLDRLRQFLVGIKFTVVTDCQALVYMNAKKTTNPQIARWYNLIQEYDFEIRHKPGEKMAHVDRMSRAPVDDPRDTMEEIVEKNLEVCLTITLEEQILMIQHSDPELRDLIQIFRKDPCDRTVGEQNRINDYSYKGGRLFRMVKNGEEERALYVIPKRIVLVSFNVKRYVRRHVAMCLECLFNKVPGGKQQGFLHPIKSGKRPFSIVHMDHVGPFVRSTKGNQELLVIVDNLTRFVRLSPVRNTSTQNVLKVMKSFVNDFGLPDKIISDRGSCFTSRQFEEFCRGNGIHHTLNSTKHPQGNGMVERVNRTVLSTIATSIEDPRRKDWDLKIKEVERDLNNAVNKTTNKTPFETLHGYSPRFHDGILRRLADEDVDPWTEPDRIQESVRSQIENKQEIMKTYYDKKRCRTIQFEVGEIVVMRHVPKMTGEPTKAQPKYRGPLIITEVLPSDTYRVTQLSERTRGRFYTTTAHISQLKSWHSEDDSATEESPDEEPEVEDTPRRNPRRSCNARFNRGRLKSRNGRITGEVFEGFPYGLHNTTMLASFSRVECRGDESTPGPPLCTGGYPQVFPGRIFEDSPLGYGALFVFVHSRSSGLDSCSTYLV
ncbi:hypothetical protein LAZ67_1003288, partial [Cordylochernes scorpioides]